LTQDEGRSGAGRKPLDAILPRPVNPVREAMVQQQRAAKPVQKLAVWRSAQPRHQQPRRKYDPINIEIRPVSGVTKVHGGDRCKYKKLAIKN